MRYRAVFRPEAAAELGEARLWYESRRAGLGRHFDASVAALITRVSANPLAFPQVHGETRRAVLNRFPYAMYFRIDGDQIVVLAVHGRRDPARWRLRS